MVSAARLIAQASRAIRDGDPRQAEGLFRRVLELDPENRDEMHAHAHFGLGVCLEALHKKADAEAAYRAALDRRPAFAEALNNLGALLVASSRAEEALVALDQALSLKPRMLSARFNRGLACFDLGRHGEAASEFRAILNAQPSQPDALNELGRCLLKQSKAREAAVLFRDGARRHPNDPRFPSNLARALELCNDLTGAEDALARALELEPSSPATSYALASLAYRQGKLAQARHRLEALLAMESLSVEQRSEALLELGLVLDASGETKAAFAAFAQGKDLRGRHQAVRSADGARFLSSVREARAWFTEERIARLARRCPSTASPPPIFFVGFPRSGTTLIEQALKSHPNVVTTDERSPLRVVLRDVTSRGRYPECLETLSRDDMAQLRQRFDDAVEAALGHLAGRVLFDKMPMNIVHLGLVAGLFPDARIVVALRDPRDVCLSCFMQRFSLAGAMVNFLDLGKTAETYQAVMDLWLHYRTVIELPCLEVRYEDLVEDFEGRLRELIDFMGLAWHADVLSFRERAGQPAATTPSYRQVTRATYQASVGRWRRYQEELGPILPRLERFVEAFGYGELDDKGPASAERQAP